MSEEIKVAASKELPTINDLNWTAEELAIMKRGDSVPVVVNGTVFQARMPRDAKR